MAAFEPLNLNSVLLLARWNLVRIVGFTKRRVCVSVILSVDHNCIVW